MVEIDTDILMVCQNDWSAKRITLIHIDWWEQNCRENEAKTKILGVKAGQEPGNYGPAREAIPKLSKMTEKGMVRCVVVTTTTNYIFHGKYLVLLHTIIYVSHIMTEIHRSLKG